MSKSQGHQRLSGKNTPFFIAVGLTLVYYWLINLPAFNQTLLHRYTTEHNVEYVVVWFFIWGVTDMAFRVMTFPNEFAALKQNWFEAKGQRVSLDEVERLEARIQAKPLAIRQSRLGQRLTRALAHLREKGSADELAPYLRQIAEEDDDRTHTNFGLIRFIAWVTPVLGFLGTVVHFGSALGGLSVDEITDRLPAVVSELGTAFNTTTGALVAATTMMFSLFLGERIERGILEEVNRRTDAELLNRFEVKQSSLSPLLAALDTSSRATLAIVEATVARQMELWEGAAEAIQRRNERAHENQASVWSVAMQQMQDRYETTEMLREQRFQKMLEVLESRREENQLHLQSSVAQVAELRGDFTKLVQALNALARGEGKLIELQHSLSENLRVITETGQIDGALHGLTAAIHLLTSRHNPSTSDRRAA